ncbi:MAG TPA: site-2 protease family protein [Pirellulaceae bacterium]|nr:site-2 protease family protein [Pirellulaceae bacterium]
MSGDRPGEPDGVSYEPWSKLPPDGGENLVPAASVIAAELIPAEPLPTADRLHWPVRRRVRLPVILFILTAISTWLAGTTGFLPFSYLSSGSLMPLRQAIVAHWDDGLIYMVCVISILLAHEMGHFVYTVIYRVPASFPYFLPLPTITGTAGAVIAMDGRRANRPQIFDIGIAGPLAGLALIIPITWIGIERLDFSQPPSGGWAMYAPLAVRWAVDAVHPGKLPDSGLIFYSQANPYFVAGWFGLLMTALNMFPVSQLDGGHITYTLWGKGAHWLARGVMVLVFAYIVYTGDLKGVLMAVLVMVIGTDHPPTSDDTAPLGWFRVMLGYASLVIPIVCFPPQILELF